MPNVHVWLCVYARVRVWVFMFLFADFGFISLSLPFCSRTTFIAVQNIIIISFVPKTLALSLLVRSLHLCNLYQSFPSSIAFSYAYFRSVHYSFSHIWEPYGFLHQAQTVQTAQTPNVGNKVSIRQIITRMSHMRAEKRFHSSLFNGRKKDGLYEVMCVCVCVRGPYQSSLTLAHRHNCTHVDLSNGKLI